MPRRRDTGRWFRVAVNMPRHPKVMGLGDAAFRAWMTAMAYCAEQRTDGVISKAAMSSIVPGGQRGRRVLSELLDGGLLESLNGHYEVHDYLDWQESKEEIEAAQEAGRKRARAYHERQRQEPLI